MYDVYTCALIYAHACVCVCLYRMSQDDPYIHMKTGNIVLFWGRDLNNFIFFCHIPSEFYIVAVCYLFEKWFLKIPNIVTILEKCILK